jgi:hypothetical protein
MVRWVYAVVARLGLYVWRPVVHSEAAYFYPKLGLWAIKPNLQSSAFACFQATQLLDKPVGHLEIFGDVRILHKHLSSGVYRLRLPRGQDLLWVAKRIPPKCF